MKSLLALFILGLIAPGTPLSLPDSDTPMLSADPLAALEVIADREGIRLVEDTRSLFVEVKTVAPQLHASLGELLQSYQHLETAGRRAVTTPSTETVEIFEAARLHFIKTSIAFGIVADETPPLPIHIIVPYLIDIDLTKGDTLHDMPVMLLVDTGGNDTYTNNAGGSYVYLEKVWNCPLDNGYTSTAALLDLHGDDTYTTTTCGAAGGATRGTGLLLDLAGNDHYEATRDGTNGGVVDSGYGLLIDAAGDDTYIGDRRTNGGASTGYFVWNPHVPAEGTLIDLTGNDTYICSTSCNGGAESLARGQLIDLGGDDEYSCANGCNGGSFGEDSIGFLFDRSGNDTYRVTQNTGANGGAYGWASWRLSTQFDGKGVAEPTLAFLIDGDGHDAYIVATVVTHDETIIPKRKHPGYTWPHTIFGAQFDSTTKISFYEVLESDPARNTALDALHTIATKTDRTLAVLPQFAGPHQAKTWEITSSLRFE